MKQNAKPLLSFSQTLNNQSKQNYKHIQNNKKLNLKQQLIHKKTQKKQELFPQLKIENGFPKWKSCTIPEYRIWKDFSSIKQNDYSQFNDDKIKLNYKTKLKCLKCWVSWKSPLFYHQWRHCQTSTPTKAEYLSTVAGSECREPLSSNRIFERRPLWYWKIPLEHLDDNTLGSNINNLSAATVCTFCKPLALFLHFPNLW